MFPPPRFFISSVSKELKSARQLTANALTTQSFKPEWQDIFSAEQGDLREMLRRKIKGCKGVVQIVGHCYGAEPPAPDAEFERRISYTQYEALHARKCRLKVWYFILDENYPTDAHEPEAEELRALQARYRAELQAGGHLYQKISNPDALKAAVLTLGHDQQHLHDRSKRWGWVVLALLALVIGGVGWLLVSEHQNKQVLGSLVEMNNKMKEALADLAPTMSKVQNIGENLTAAQQFDRACALLDKQLGLPAGTLARQLPGYAYVVLNEQKDATPLERAQAAYALGQFAQAETLAAQSADQDAQTAATATQKAIAEYSLAGQAAERNLDANGKPDFAGALVNFHKAEKLTDPTRDVGEWAGVQENLAQLLDLEETLASRSSAVDIYRAAIATAGKALGAEDGKVLALRVGLAYVLDDLTRYPEAQQELEAVLALQQKQLQPKDAALIKTRYNLARLYLGEGKYAEAKAEYAQLVDLETALAGADDTQTLQFRNNLALAKMFLGEYADAENIFHDAITRASASPKLGPLDAHTLGWRVNLAITLGKDGKLSEAETELNDVLALDIKTAEDPDNNSRVLDTRSERAQVWLLQGKSADAEKELSDIVARQKGVDGPLDLGTLESLGRWADAVRLQGRYAEAETKYRDVIAAETQALRSDHHYLLENYYGLALCLQAENNLPEARSYAQRAADGALPQFGANHPDTLKYQQLSQKLSAAN